MFVQKNRPFFFFVIDFAKRRAKIFIMKRLTVLSLFAALVAGCATPPQKAEKLAHQIEKETLVTPSMDVAQTQDPQPEHLFKSIGNTAALLGGVTVKLAADGAECVAICFTTLPVAVVSATLEVFVDCFRLAGEAGKLVFPPPPPKVV